MRNAFLISALQIKSHHAWLFPKFLFPMEQRQDNPHSTTQFTGFSKSTPK
jgi:hypothetical protein